MTGDILRHYTKARQSEIRIFAKGKEVRRQGTENHMTT